MTRLIGQLPEVLDTSSINKLKPLWKLCNVKSLAFSYVCRCRYFYYWQWLNWLRPRCTQLYRMSWIKGQCCILFLLWTKNCIQELRPWWNMHKWIPRNCSKVLHFIGNALIQTNIVLILQVILATSFRVHFMTHISMEHTKRAYMIPQFIPVQHWKDNPSIFGPSTFHPDSLANEFI